MKVKLNTRLIDEPKKLREAMMTITAALYTGISKSTPMEEAAETAGVCAAMWKICDALDELIGGEAEC